MLRHFLFIIISALLLSHTGCGVGGGGNSGNQTPPGNTPTNASKGGCFTSISSVGGSNISISGKVEYEDKEYGLSGFTNNTTGYYKAVRYAYVEVVDTATSNPLVSTFTNSSGIYRIPTLTFTNVTSAYLRVGSYTTGNTNSKPDVEIRDRSYGYRYAVGCDSTFVPQAGTSVTTNLSIPTSNQAAGAFNLMDVFTSGGEFINSLAGTNPILLNAYWEVGNSYGTWYCSGAGDPLCPWGEGIYVLNDTVGYQATGDTDEYDDDVLWHEYGHFVAAKFSKDDSQGGIHYLDGNDYDLRLAWSEGWGDFFPSAIKSWLNSTNSALLSTATGVSASYYIDTYDTAGWSFDIGNNSGAPYIHSSNEVAVANILWRTMNETTSKMSGIWDVFANYIPTYKLQFPSLPINLETFWDGWLARQSSNGSLSAIFNNRAIFYQQDSYETDNSPSSGRKATIGTAETHYLYNSSDVDFVAFDAVSGQPYIITTSNLKNGADTFITLYNPDQTPTAYSNDNASGQAYTAPFNCSYDQYGNWVCHENGYDTLGSRIIFTASTTGMYYVKVNTSAYRPASAGEYGTYSLKITTP